MIIDPVRKGVREALREAMRLSALKPEEEELANKLLSLMCHKSYDERLRQLDATLKERKAKNASHVFSYEEFKKFNREF